MIIKKTLLYFTFLVIAILSFQCTDFLEPPNEDFGVKSFVSNIKSYDASSEYINSTIPFNDESEVVPYVSVQSWVVKGKDVIVSITVPADATEIYFGAINSQGEYMGLTFHGTNQSIDNGYYRLQLNNDLRQTAAPSDSANRSFLSYQVVLSSNKNISINKFELLLSCNTSLGFSRITNVSIDVVEIARYQEILKTGFRQLSGYTYRVVIKTPSGDSVVYSYDKNTGVEIFDNSLIPTATLSYSSSLNIKWVDFLNPEFGPYTIRVTVQIDLSLGSQTILVLLAIITEGIIDQVSLNAQIYQTGHLTAVGIATANFRYFDAYRYSVIIDPVLTDDIKRIPKNVLKNINVTVIPSLTGNEFIDLELKTKNGSTGEAVFVDINGFEHQSIRIQNTQTVNIKGVLTSDMKENILLSAKYNGVQLAIQSFAVRTWPTNYHENVNLYSPYPPPRHGTIQLRYDWESESGSEFDLSGLQMYEWVDYPGPGPVFEYSSPPYRNIKGTPYPYIVDDPDTALFTIGITQQQFEIGDPYTIWLFFWDTHRIPTTSNTELNNSNLDIAFRQPYEYKEIIATQYYRLRDPVLMDPESFKNLLGPLTITRTIEEVDPNLKKWQYKIEKTGHTPVTRMLP